MATGTRNTNGNTNPEPGTWNMEQFDHFNGE